MAATPAAPPAAPDPQFPGKSTQINDPKSEADETRDSNELVEHHARMSTAVPIGLNGKPMVKVTVGVSDKIPTVVYGNVVIGPIMLERYIEDDSNQNVIDAGRELQRAAEYIVGVERTLLQYALDPAKKVQNPYTGEDAFAAKPAGYDATKAAPVAPILPDPPTTA
jgi:hypothetical protein